MSDENEDKPIEDPSEWIARVAAAEERARILSEELERQRASAADPVTPKEPSEQKFTAAQIQQFVENGQIDENTAREYLRKQERDEDMNSVREKLRAELRAEELDRKLSSTLSEYKDLVPALKDKGSREWDRCNREYSRLIELGMPKGKPTELLAVEHVLGRVEELRAAPEPKRPSHRETGGGGSSRSSSENAKIPEPIRKNQNLLQHYERMIEKGMYKGWDDPNIAKEAKYVH